MHQSQSTIEVRPAVLSDLAFIDDLQKQFSRQVGYFPKQAIEAFIEKHLVCIAFENGQKAAYLLGRRTYLKNQDTAIIYQAAVDYDARRHAIGSALVDIYCKCLGPGTRLVSLWCAQDLEANLFWEANGFTAIAYRAGSRRKKRIHIFWQKRITEEESVRLWFPSHTSGGWMREARIVLPLGPGEHWSQPDTLILPVSAGNDEEKAVATGDSQPRTGGHDAWAPARTGIIRG